MTLTTGQTLPDATLLRIGADGPESISLSARLSGRKVVLFGLPGAFTGTCTTAHVPSFIDAMDGLKARGVENVICVAVNDPFVMQAWDEATGAGAAGIEMLADADATFTKAIGMAFTAPPVGFYDRSSRYALYAEDGVVRVLNLEEGAGSCEISSGATMLSDIDALG